MIPNANEIKNKGKGLMAAGAGFVVFVIGCNVFYFLCHDHFMALLAGAGSGLVVFVVMVSGALIAPEVMKPPAKLYNLTPIYVLAEIKETLSTQWFGEKKWILDSANQDKQTLKYSFKHRAETEQSELGKKAGMAPALQEGIVLLTVTVERVGEGASVETSYRIAHGLINFDMQDIITQTTSLIDQSLKALEAQRHGQ